jgi:hypothetical protein
MVRVFNHLQNQQKSYFEIISNRLPVLAVSGKVIAINPDCLLWEVIEGAFEETPVAPSTTKLLESGCVWSGRFS